MKIKRTENLASQEKDVEKLTKQIEAKKQSLVLMLKLLI